MRNGRHHSDQDKTTQETVFHHFPYSRHHLVALAFADDTARQGVGGRSESNTWNDKNHIGAAYHRRNTDGRLPHLLNHHKKDEPCAEREQPLNHARKGHFEDVAHQGGLPLVPTEHAVFLVRNLDVCVNPEEAERRDFGHQRGQGRAANTHFGQTCVAENQCPVEKDVDDGHNDGRKSDDLGAADADIERAEEEVEHHEHNAKLPESQVLARRRINIFGLDDDMQQLVAEEEKDAEQEQAQSQHEQGPVLEHHADFAEVALAETPRYEDLDAHGKAHRQGGEDEIIQARHHRRAQFYSAEVTEEGCVGEGNDGLRKVAQHDWISDAPNLAVRNGGFNHAAKIGKNLTQNPLN